MPWWAHPRIKQLQNIVAAFLFSYIQATYKFLKRNLPKEIKNKYFFGESNI